jgi:hypothetical protein
LCPDAKGPDAKGRATIFTAKCSALGTIEFAQAAIGEACHGLPRVKRRAHHEVQ